MKFVAITFLALIAVVVTSPIFISDNKVGDIESVAVNANLEASHQSATNIGSAISIIADFLKLQANSAHLQTLEGGEIKKPLETHATIQKTLEN